MSELNHSKSPLHSSLTVNEDRPLAELKEALQKLYAQDKKAEPKKRLFFGLIIATGILTLFFLPWSLLLGPILFLPFFLLYNYYANLDIDDRKLDTALGLLNTLGPEIKPNRSIHVWLDFGGYHRTPVNNSTSWLSSNGSQEFRKHWLTMELSLLDGTQLKLEGHTEVKQKQRQKRKYTKTKAKITDVLSLQLRSQEGASIDPQTLQRIQHQLAKFGIRKCRITPRQSSFTYYTPVAVRSRLRSGWTISGFDKLLSGNLAVQVVAMGYQAHREARRNTADQP